MLAKWKNKQNPWKCRGTGCYEVEKSRCLEMKSAGRSGYKRGTRPPSVCPNTWVCHCVLCVGENQRHEDPGLGLGLPTPLRGCGKVCIGMQPHCEFQLQGSMTSRSPGEAVRLYHQLNTHWEPRLEMDGWMDGSMVCVCARKGGLSVLLV